MSNLDSKIAAGHPRSCEVNYTLFYSSIYPANTSTSLLVPSTIINQGPVGIAETTIYSLPGPKSSKLYLHAADVQNPKDRVPWDRAQMTQGSKGRGAVAAAQTSEERAASSLGCVCCKELGAATKYLLLLEKYRQYLEKQKEVPFPLCPSSEVPLVLPVVRRKTAGKINRTS